ncbi:hypothetical protein [Natrinema thermotolerans]|uniref:hypothetical protein n=1 Tax=Natrinema thermotolerans TaxID=121872 RepID=UPI0006786343|nr:hypothetical protein [Natrinema thermotolerans]QCC57341.1 hypothetical protein DVR14_01280 [Natrinema thermotolerans]
MPKYDPDTSHWDEEPDGPPAWKEDTSAKRIEIDVRLHDQGYQTDEKWTVHCTDRLEDEGIIAGYAIEHRNKGNYWREGERWRDAVDFADLPLRVRKRVAAVLNRDLEEITPPSRTIHREDGTGLADDLEDEPRTVECVHCDEDVLADAIVDHHTSEHPDQRYDPLWYDGGESN